MTRVTERIWVETVLLLPLGQKAHDPESLVRGHREGQEIPCPQRQRQGGCVCLSAVTGGGTEWVGRWLTHRQKEPALGSSGFSPQGPGDNGAENLGT